MKKTHYRSLFLASIFVLIPACIDKDINPIHTDRRETIIFESDSQQYRADLDISLEAQRLIPFGTEKETFDAVTEQIKPIINKAAATLPPTDSKNQLGELLLQEINDQLVEVEQGSFGWATAQVMGVANLKNLVEECEKSFAKFMSRNEGFYQGGGCTGGDSDGDGNISAETNILNPTRNQIPVYYLLCDTNGSGCKGNDARNTVIIEPQIINPKQYNDPISPVD